MTLSSFCSQPRKGHLERLQRVYGYLSKMRHGAIRIRTDLPDLSDLPTIDYDWSTSPYADSCEELPSDAPPPRGRSVQITTYADSNLLHDVLSGKSVTAILHFLNKTPIDWFCKKQSTVETATFGSESCAARTACEQIRDLKLTLLYLGVPLEGTCILAGDNKTVVNTTSMPHGKLHKRHLMLSYHYVREAVATGAIRYYHVPGVFNFSDVLSTHWSYSTVWPLLQPLLFWQAPTLPTVDPSSCDPEIGE